jgi:diketogulonate reductase-like aldo/keto reductase
VLMECEFKKLRDHSYTSLNAIKARKLGMTSFDKIDTFALGTRSVNRLGYGAMQLAGPGVFGPPKDREAALAVLREAVASGINHIDTSDFYGPHVTSDHPRGVAPLSR